MEAKKEQREASLKTQKNSQKKIKIQTLRSN